MNAKTANKYLLLLFVAGIGLSVWLMKNASTQFSSASSELASLRKEATELDLKREGLEKAKITLAENADTISILSKAVPVDKDQAKVVEELYAIANKAGVTIDSVGFPASTLGSDTKPVQASSTTTTTQTSGSATTPTTATPKPSTRSISQATPLKEIPGIQAIELSLGAINSNSLPKGSGIRYSELMSFIRQLERNQRAIQITALGIGQDKVVNGEPTFSLTLSLTIFVRS